MDNYIVAHRVETVKQPVGFEFKKHCPKCGGNLYVDKDFYGIMEECLQCGFVRNLSKDGK